MLELIVLILTVIANLILAIIVFMKDSQRVVNRSFAFFATTLMGWAVANYLSVHPVLFDQLFWIRFDISWAAMMTMALLLLANIFPSGSPYFKRINLAVILVGITVGGLALSPWLFTHVDYSSGTAQPVPGPGIIPFALFVLSSLFLSIYILVRRFLTLKGKAKEYIRYAIAGMTVTFLLLVIFNFIFVLVFHNTAFIVFTPAFSLLFAASFAYGMVRARLFDIRFILARVVAYALLLLVAGVLYGFLGRDFPSSLSASNLASRKFLYRLLS
jgi:hypothetical protein